ncbi:hypothetical protein CWB96_05010 [Pseudoalteromonas citrea]|uniref:Uncharacterized protein n=1 Tax=Pseudoalteromonas citrea TaxID=43655 RepID=A0A5S3XSG8_9GAMM|nr:hypothetical protein [Pseudoalteromonas citrea]TMP44737.1 hypothetical protein CWB97_05875 [Pseudoalteromonas citrea]TMP61110.1 hypothetical protein CWB96_05010 [Pseudoalteromonas citrea]
MHKYTQLLVSTSLTITLAACGGSSDTSNQDIGSSQNTVNNTSTVSLKTFDRDNEPYQATVVLHDSEGKAILTQKLDNTGQFSAEVPENAKHISIIGYSYSGFYDNKDHYDRKIYTELNIEQGGSLGNFYFDAPVDNSSVAPPIDCTWVTVDISELTQVTYDNYSLNYWHAPVHNEDQSTPLTTSSTICFDPTKNSNKTMLFTLTSNDGSYSKGALITLDESATSYQLTNESFTHDGILVQPELSTSANEFRTISYIEHDFNKITAQPIKTSINNLNPIFVYPTITEHNMLTQYGDDSLDSNGVRINLHTQSRSYINSDGQVELNELPESLHSLSDDIINLTQSQSLNYDFSHIDERFSQARWSFRFKVRDEYADWSIRGPISANIPDLAFGDAFPTPTEEIQFSSMEIQLFGYVGGPKDYAQFRAFLNQRKPNSAFLTQPEYRQYVSSSMWISVNN